MTLCSRTRSCGLKMQTNQQTQILVSSDDIDLVAVFKDILGKKGFHFRSVSTADECLTECLRKPPDILLIFSTSDYLTNHDLCRQIRSDITIYFPIIVGKADIVYPDRRDGYQQAFEAGANACFGIVFDIDDILELINTLLADPSLTGLVDHQSKANPDT